MFMSKKVFRVRDIIEYNEMFSILALTELMVYLQSLYYSTDSSFNDLSLNIKTSVLSDKNFILCFNS